VCFGENDCVDCRGQIDGIAHLDRCGQCVNTSHSLYDACTVCNGPPAATDCSTCPSSCRCEGQWRGPRCDYCLCYNGGLCTANGTCMCASGWGGSDCRVCSTACARFGRCPLPLDSADYGVRSCRATHCSHEELVASRATSDACRACDLVMGNGCAGTGGTCTGQCEWDPFTSSCRRRDPRIAKGNVCSCPGQRFGTDCEECNVSTLALPSATCDESGNVVECDGLPPDDPTMWVDRQGKCSPSTVDGVGCDGFVNGSARTTAGECVPSRSGDGILYPGPRIDVEASRLALLHACDALASLGLSRSCLLADFYAGQVTDDVRDLLRFTKATGRFAEAGFSTANETDAIVSLEWLFVTVRSKTGDLDELEELQGIAARSGGVVVGNSWRRSLQRRSVRLATWRCVATSCVASWCTSIVATASFRAAAGGLLAGISFVFVGVASLSLTAPISAHHVLAVAVMLWPVLVASTVQLRAYVDFLHDTECNLFARQTSRINAVRGMMQRTVVPTNAGPVVVGVATLPLFAAKSITGGSIASTYAVLSGVAFLHTALLVPTALSIFGPVTSAPASRSKVVALLSSCALWISVAIAFIVLSDLIV